MISFRPLWDKLEHKLGRSGPAIEDLAVETWEVSPSVDTEVCPAFFLPGQLERITKTEFGSMERVLGDMRGGHMFTQPPTRAFRLRDVDLIDGVLYAAGAVHFLRDSPGRLTYRHPREVAHGALYESWIGNRWFGLWLSDDCPRYRLAATHGIPVTSVVKSPWPHVSQYEALLGMSPQRHEQVRFEELILFDDQTNNHDRRARSAAMRDALAAAIPHDPHPGVFLIRGKTGAARILENEMELAEHLQRSRGFRIFDPQGASVAEILAACAGAQVIAGVEGSQMQHGLSILPDGGTFFCIFPANRVGSVFKIVTDRQGYNYAFIVAEGPETAMRVSLDEVDRTLDLLPG